VRAVENRGDGGEVREAESAAEFWNPKTETLDREDLRALQLAKLRRMAEWAEARSPFYRRSFAAAGFHTDQLKTFADIARIPLLTRDEWMRSQLDAAPFGELPVAGADAAIRLHTTSGTSGRTPLRALDSRKDWRWAAEMWCYALWSAGVRANDVGYLAFGYGSFIGFWGLHGGMEKIGVLTIPGGAQTTAQRVRQIIDFDVTIVASTPTYALRLAQEAQTLGIDLANGSKVHTVMLSGEPAGSIPETKALIEQQWGAKAYDTAGMTEISTIFMFEPKEQPGGCHIIEDHFIEQVLDPASGDEVAYGEPGERVCTSFGRSMIPLLRYRTADLVVKVPHTAAKSGRTWDLYQGGILGRVDDMNSCAARTSTRAPSSRSCAASRRSRSSRSSSSAWTSGTRSSCTRSSRPGRTRRGGPRSRPCSGGSSRMRTRACSSRSGARVREACRASSSRRGD
jgi:phenylacetate-coenzyme A ligase PaaK-like adenylate-forming protein